MQIYPPARTLSGGTLFYEYDPVAVTKVLDCLVPANMLLLVAARCFEGQTNLEERWYACGNYIREIQEKDCGVLKTLWDSKEGKKP
jgi:hypothetical protein